MGGTSHVTRWFGGQILQQLALLVGILLVFALLGSNTIATMHKFGATPGFGFLDRPASFAIGESLIPYAANDSYARAILVGLLNTIEVAAAGCVLATLLGVAVAVMRLSGNLLLGGLMQAYVEVVRNTPLLLQLFFWAATLLALPSARQAMHPVAGVYLSNRGVVIPAVHAEWLLPAILVLLAAVTAGRIWLGRRDRAPNLKVTVAALIAAIALPMILAAGTGATFDAPELRGFNFQGGMTLSPEFAALLVGLTVNSAASISEIVRGAIQSVPKGQWDGAAALGFSRWGILRFVVLPQATRVAIPVLTSSYLTLAKNSSLAVAIGFPDLVNVINTTANQTGQAFETLTILIVAYLALSLAVSSLLNRYNRTLQERGA